MSESSSPAPAVRVIDAHLDLAFNALGHGADLRLPIEQLRRSEFGRKKAAKVETPTVCLPALREGGVGLVFATIFSPSRGSVFNVGGPEYESPEQAHAMGRRQLAYYHDLAAAGEVSLVRDHAELDQALSDAAVTRPALLISIEGADLILNVSELGQWHADGLRIIGPAWGRTRFGGGTGAPGGLTDLGRELLAEMRRCAASASASTSRINRTTASGNPSSAGATGRSVSATPTAARSCPATGTSPTT
jgi:membrane dipeptidase